MAASATPTRARLAMIAPSESSQSGAVPNMAYRTVATISRRLRPSRSTITPANGASSASESAGTVSARGTNAFAPGVEAKWSCILGSTGAISTAPRMGRQLPAISRIRRSRCARPETATGDGAPSSTAAEDGGGDTEPGMATPGNGIRDAGMPAFSGADGARHARDDRTSAAGPDSCVRVATTMGRRGRHRHPPRDPNPVSGPSTLWMSSCPRCGGEAGWAGESVHLTPEFHGQWRPGLLDVPTPASRPRLHFCKVSGAPSDASVRSRGRPPGPAAPSSR